MYIIILQYIHRHTHMIDAFLPTRDVLTIEDGKLVLRQEEDPTRGKARPDPVTMALEGSSIVENQPFLEDFFFKMIFLWYVLIFYVFSF